MKPEGFGVRIWQDSCLDHDFPRIGFQEKAADSIRVMSFNVRCADVNGVEFPERTDIVVREIKEGRPDTLGVQEATPGWMQVLDRELTDYAWVGINREDGGSPMETGETCPVFYLKEKYELVDSGNFWLSETPEVPSKCAGAGCKRICTWVKLKDRRTGYSFIHVNTHFDHRSEEARVIGAKTVTRFISESCQGWPLFFTADMNALDDEEAYGIMTSKLKDARKSPAAIKFGTFHNCSPETYKDYVIDYILCSPELKLDVYRTVTVGIDNRFVSDHFPIYADVSTLPVSPA